MLLFLQCKLNDANVGTQLVFEISMNDGTALPSWLYFDPISQNFSGNPGNLGIFDLNEFDIRVTAKDWTNASVFDVIRLSVTTPNEEPTGVVSISGTTTQGQTLIASNTLADVDGLGAISYQWLADDSNIDGATASTFTLTQAQVGKAISVKASYTDGHGTAEAVTSIATAAVANINDGLGDTFTGSANNDTLTGLASNDILNGLAGHDTLDGGAGADAMLGGDGNDLYKADNIGDTVTETNASLASGGNDTVWSSVSFTLGANVENLRLMAGNIDGTGNELNNILYAGEGNNRLDGGAGMDTVSYQYATAEVTVSLANTLQQPTAGSALTRC
jgi:Ca2+-binding RTX toxin-like protein